MKASIYTTDLAKPECLRRLQQRTFRGGWWTPWAEGTISVRTRGDHFSLFAWGPLNVRNSFAPLFKGRLEDCNGHTRIVGRFRMHRLVQVFLVVWFGGLAAGAALMLLLPASGWGSGQRPPAFALLAPVGMSLLGFAFVWFCRWLARGQKESLRCFLERELEAQPSGGTTLLRK